MSSVYAVIDRLPAPLRGLAIKHKELIKFGTVGGITFVIDNAVYYTLVWTILEPKPASAKVIAVLVATIASYILNSEWSFSGRGGHHKHNEAALFFLVSGIGVAINTAPLYISRHWMGFNHEYWSFTWVAFWDFFWGSIVGMLLAMVFRWWAFRRWVFPDQITIDEVDAPTDPAGQN